MINYITSSNFLTYKYLFYNTIKMTCIYKPINISIYNGSITSSGFYPSKKGYNVSILYNSLKSEKLSVLAYPISLDISALTFCVGYESLKQLMSEHFVEIL